MYCKNCNTLLEDGKNICPKCHFNNDEDLEETTEIYLDKVSQSVNPPKVQRKINFVTFFILFILLIAGVITYYVYVDVKDINEKDTTSTTTTQKIVVLNQTFNFNGLVMNYNDDEFGTSTNTIFYKNNNEYNINILVISEEEYQIFINSKELLDSKIGNIVTQTFADENSYSHIFEYKGSKYLLTVNYLSDDSENSGTIQNDMSKIINTLVET